VASEVALTEKEVSAVMVAPNLVTAVMLRGAGRKQEGRGVAVARDVPEKNKRREKGKNGGDRAAPLLNGNDGVGDGWRRAPRGGKEWGEGGGWGTAVGWCGVAGTGPEPAGAGGRYTLEQNRGDRVAARWARAIVAGGNI
jgi:hypothetical protein